MPDSSNGSAATAAADALGEQEARRGARAGQQHDELLAAVASGDVAAAHLRADAVRELPQHLVARQVTEPVVDRLEVIDVDHEARQRRSLAAAARELLVQARLQIAAVVPTGQHIRETAADEPRAVDGALERERGDDGEVVQELRAERRLNRSRSRLPKFRLPINRSWRVNGSRATLSSASDVGNSSA